MAKRKLPTPWAALVIASGIAVAIAAHIFCEPTLAADKAKFGTFFTPTGSVIELYKTGPSSIEGEVVRLDDHGANGPILVRGDNAEPGQMTLEFYRDGKPIDSISYARTATRTETNLGSQIYTAWQATNADSLNYDLRQIGAGSLQSVIIGTIKPSKVQSLAPRASAGIQLQTYLLAKRHLDEFFKRESNLEAQNEKLDLNGDGLFAVRTARSTTAYLNAAAISQNLSPADVHVQTLGDDQTVVFLKSAKVAALAPTLTANKGWTNNIDVVPSELMNANIGIKIPVPNVIETYVSKFSLEEPDRERLSRIYERMGVQTCGTDPPRPSMMLIYCDYYRDKFAADGDAIWYRTAVSIVVTPAGEANFSNISMFTRTAVANYKKSDYDTARRQWSWPSKSPQDAESFLARAFISALTSEYPQTHR